MHVRQPKGLDKSTVWYCDSGVSLLQAAPQASELFRHFLGGTRPLRVEIHRFDVLTR